MHTIQPGSSKDFPIQITEREAKQRGNGPLPGSKNLVREELFPVREALVLSKLKSLSSEMVSVHQVG